MKRRIVLGIGLALMGMLFGGWLVARGLPALAAAVASVDGDVNGDARLDLSDPVYLLRFLFQGGPPPTPCPAIPPPLPASMVIVVRHAEKAPGADTDGGPHLTDAGKVQAQMLKEILKDIPVHFIAASTLFRTRETVQPVAERDPANPIPISEFGDTSEYDGLIDFVLTRPQGSTTLVAHHSPTLHGILKELGAPETVVDKLSFSGASYNNIVVLLLQPGLPTLMLPLRGQDSAAFPALHLGPTT